MRTTHAQALARWTAALDLLGPHRGPCGLCGGPDARHRIADAIAGEWIAGDPTEVVADEHHVPATTVLELAALTLLVENAGRRQHLPIARWWAAPVLAVALLLTGCTGSDPATGTITDRWVWDRDGLNVRAIRVSVVDPDGETRTVTMQVKQAVWDACHPGATWTADTGTCGVSR